MPAINHAALRQFHLTAERWERCRALWFQKQGNAKMSVRCECLAIGHQNAARDAMLDMQKQIGRDLQQSPWS